MPIYVISTIKQKNAAIFPLLDDADLLGGFRACTSTVTRDAIPASYRKEGMFVWTNVDSKLWRLGAGLTNADWIEVTVGGGSGNALVDLFPCLFGVPPAGTPVYIDVGGDVKLSDASGTLAQQEVIGLVQTAAAGLAQVVTNGVCPYAPGGLTPGQPMYLKSGGGIVNAPPPPSPSGVAITRVGTARTATTITVQIQQIGET